MWKRVATTTSVAGELGEQVLNGRHRLSDDALLVVGSEPRLEDGPELLDHDRIVIAEQEPNVVVVLEEPHREAGEGVQIGGVLLRTRTVSAVKTRLSPSIRDPRRASCPQVGLQWRDSIGSGKLKTRSG